MSHSGASVGTKWSKCVNEVNQGGASVGRKWSKYVKERKRVRVLC